jgi:hypothetical protein
MRCPSLPIRLDSEVKHYRVVGSVLTLPVRSRFCLVQANSTPGSHNWKMASVLLLAYRTISPTV